MSGELVSLDAARRRRALAPRNRLSAQAEVRGSMVAILARDRDTLCTPAATRTFARALISLADSVDGGNGSPGLTDAEVQLEALRQMVLALDEGRLRMSDVVAGLRASVGAKR
jgi:hypothetical protein